MAAKRTDLPPVGFLSVIQGLLPILGLIGCFWHMILSLFKMGLPFVHPPGTIQSYAGVLSLSICLGFWPLGLAVYPFLLERKQPELPLETLSVLIKQVFLNVSLVCLFWAGVLHFNLAAPIGEPQLYTVSQRESLGKWGRTTRLTLIAKAPSQSAPLQLELLPDRLGLTRQDIQIGDQMRIRFEKGRLGLSWVSALEWHATKGSKAEKHLLWPRQFELLDL